MNRTNEKTGMLPVLPLRGAVAFPSVPMTLETNHDKTTAACESAKDGDGYVFLIAQTDSENPNPTKIEDYYRVGTVARISKYEKLPDGTLRITLDGICRAELISVKFGKEYHIAGVIAREVTVGNEQKTEELKREVMRLFSEFTKCIPNFAKELEAQIKGCADPARLADLIASVILLKFEDKQDILEEFDTARRLELLYFKMERELKYLQDEMEIHRKVKQKIDENQRDYYMREQIKVLQEELGEADEPDEEISEYLYRIAHTKLPKNVADRLVKEVGKLDKMAYASAESTVIRGYLDTCLDIPWENHSKDRIDIAAAKKTLDKDHYGLDDVKERILEYIAVQKLTPNIKSQILCLVGAPGVGKTSVASSIARAMNRRFVRVALGGVRDESDIRGHRKTYIGSMPGRIVNALIDAKTMNPVILLDEIDKLTRDAHGDPSSALLEVLDPDQNKAFRDHFVELPVDLSDCLFIATANTLDTVPKPLLDRMEVVELKTYTRAEKLMIAKNHLIPKELHRHGLTKRNLGISDDALFEIIDHYTVEAGVRNLEREIAKICRKTARLIVENENIKSVKVKTEDIKKYLGPQKVLDLPVPERDEVGIVNGLAYTEAGGDMLKVEAAVMDGTGKLELTGSLGDVMKESAKIAFSIIRVRAAKYALPADFYKTKDIHVHFPEGAVPKDGPSAGVTLVTALVSELGGHPVRRDVAMTGEVTLSGRVIAIGGLREKTMAAYKNKIKTVLVPAENRQDVERLDGFIKESIRFVYCNTVDEVLDNALVRTDIASSGKSESEPPIIMSELHNKRGQNETEYRADNT